MKTLFVTIVAFVMCLPAQANLYTYNFTGINQAIQDNDPAGLSDTRVLSGMTGFPSTTINDVNVTLTISGGYNGDLYGYLVHDSGFVVLLNRIGRTSTDEFGSSGSGFTVTFDGQGSTDIHLAPYSPNAPLSGTWSPDGRETDPANVLNTDTRTTSLDSFNGVDPNGSWTLFLADLSPGDQSTLVGWSLEISTVPEPITWALGAFAILLSVRKVGKWIQRRFIGADDAVV